MRGFFYQLQPDTANGLPARLRPVQPSANTSRGLDQTRGNADRVPVAKSIGQCEYRDNQFDVSVLYSTLHHLPASAADALRELVRVISERIVLVEGVIPATGFLRTALLLWYRLVDGGYHYYTLAELESLFADLRLQAESKNLYSPIKHMLLAVLDCRTQRTTPVPRPALDHAAHASPKC